MFVGMQDVSIIKAYRAHFVLHTFVVDTMHVLFLHDGLPFGVILCITNTHVLYTYMYCFYIIFECDVIRTSCHVCFYMTITRDPYM
jgi:hypothetical protein